MCGVLLARTVRPRFLGLEGRDKRHFWLKLLRKLGHKADVKVGGHLYTRAIVVETWSKDSVVVLRRLDGECPVSKGERYPVNSDDIRVKRAVQYLRELETSGVELHEILGGEAGSAFIRDGCEGEPEIAYAAFALVHAPTVHICGVGKTKNPGEN